MTEPSFSSFAGPVPLRAVTRSRAAAARSDPETELVWVGLAETSRFCSMPGEILLQFELLLRDELAANNSEEASVWGLMHRYSISGTSLLRKLLAGLIYRYSRPGTTPLFLSRLSFPTFFARSILATPASWPPSGVLTGWRHRDLLGLSRRILQIQYVKNVGFSLDLEYAASVRRSNGMATPRSPGSMEKDLADTIRRECWLFAGS